jgi:prevent-host-death family protein
MIEVNIHEAKTQLSRLIAQAEAGEEVIIARSGEPVVKLVAVSKPSKKRVLGADRGVVIISEDFDDPVDPETWV